MHYCQNDASLDKPTKYKDNVFSKEQIFEIEKRAKRLGLDPVKYLENAKKNLLKAPIR
jgi:hypothetical protein